MGQIFQVEDRAEKLISDMQAQVAEVEAKVADKTPVSFLFMILVKHLPLRQVQVWLRI